MKPDPKNPVEDAAKKGFNTIYTDSTKYPNFDLGVMNAEDNDSETDEPTEEDPDQQC